MQIDSPLSLSVGFIFSTKLDSLFAHMAPPPPITAFICSKIIRSVGELNEICLPGGRNVHHLYRVAGLLELNWK